MAVKYFCDFCDTAFSNSKDLGKLVISRPPVPEYEKDICENCITAILDLQRTRCAHT